uniref:Uncharacterized protein n=1 Tax=Chromera velia CCMP2878 TaxID=1169474 RepID=A0A0G4GAB3_9ALVE|eukprot:Cvel_4413.t1-p1 / transcript=Cvel_4413.t1 / gene=Cvel_4413 / organism=Chromera_velia_CCMP2878 / gene_product=hypothetical protein / transcript_product=hypothetical protein / location=Cvel_scaffold192:13612-18579(-) / protein_length=375 / sequence_SO=supercontig / SO=protein_coding / is_pseudo=false
MRTALDTFERQRKALKDEKLLLLEENHDLERELQVLVSPLISDLDMELIKSTPSGRQRLLNLFWSFALRLERLQEQIAGRWEEWEKVRERLGRSRETEARLIQLKVANDELKALLKEALDFRETEICPVISQLSEGKEKLDRIARKIRQADERRDDGGSLCMRDMAYNRLEVEVMRTKNLARQLESEEKQRASLGTLRETLRQEVKIRCKIVMSLASRLENISKTSARQLQEEERSRQQEEKETLLDRIAQLMCEYSQKVARCEAIRHQMRQQAVQAAREQTRVQVRLADADGRLAACNGGHEDSPLPLPSNATQAPAEHLRGASPSHTFVPGPRKDLWSPRPGTAQSGTTLASLPSCTHGPIPRGTFSPSKFPP